MKTINMDELFKKFAKDFITENSDMIAGKDPDDVLADIYDAFESTAFFELGGKTPLTFYGSDVDHAKLLKEHSEAGVPISDYLIDSAAKYGDEDEIIKLVSAENDEDLVMTAIDVLEKKECEKAFYRYIDLLFDKNTDECIVDKIVEVLADHADPVADELLFELTKNSFREDDVAYILSHSKIRRDGIADLLRKGLLMGDKISEYCADVVTYGDESLLPDLEELIDTVEDYVSYKELNLAIESLGGEPRSDRDFETDVDYIKIKESSAKEGDNGDGDKN